MKRSELYALVWKTSMRNLGPQLGLSDRGLKKICTRFDIPVPGVGYWARVEAGQSPRVPMLPRPETDPEIALPDPRRPSQDPAVKVTQRAARVARNEASHVAAVEIVGVPETLEGCHPLVKKTAAFFRSVEKEEQAKAERAIARAGGRWEPSINWSRSHRMSMGRYLTDGAGCLSIAATLNHWDWILRFHEGLIRGLLANGCRLHGSKETRGAIVTRGAGELRINFSELMEKVSGVSLQSYPYKPAEYRPLDRYKVKLERDGWTQVRQWVGSRTQLESDLPRIVREAVGVVEAEEVRAKFEAEEAARKRAQWALDEIEREKFRAEAKRNAERKALADAQLGRVKVAARALAERKAIDEVLGLLESQDDSGGVRAWIGIVRSNLTDPVQALCNELRTEIARATPPAWWALLS